MTIEYTNGLKELEKPIEYDKKRFCDLQDFPCGCIIAFSKDLSEGFSLKLCKKCEKEEEK